MSAGVTMSALTVRDDDLEWHRRALACGLKVAGVHDGDVYGGYFAPRGERRGHRVPAIIFREMAWDDFRCIINGKECDPEEQWPFLAQHPVTYHEYLILCELAEQELREAT